MRTVTLAPLALLTALAFQGCGGGSNGTDGTATDNGTTEPFPSDLAVTSPLETAADDNTTRSASTRTTHFSSNSRYAWATLRINALLEGTTPLRDIFTPALFTSQASDASCFGPALDYENHPDATTPNAGQLPTGDLGLWQDTDDTTGHACAAAQLNARMSGFSDRSLMGLMSLASMISIADDNGIALPTAATSINLTSEMNALGISDVTFDTSTIALDSGSTTWSYQLAFTYTDDSARDHAISITLSHTPGASATQYTGMLTYRIDDYFSGGHCPGDETYNGTVYYDRESATDIFIDAREGTYCDHGTVGPVATDTDIDPTETYAFLDPSTLYTGSGSDGWGNNFSILRADFNPLTLEGDYAYIWQAGPNDSHSRVFNIGLNYHDDTELVDGEAYYGYGDQVGDTDGSIQGFICNWAGPGNDHTLQQYAQRQFVTYNSSTELFDVPAGGSDILYAPTNNCTYDGSGTFWYDRDLNTVNDATDQVEIHEVGSGNTPEIDMMAPGSGDDLDENGTPTITEAIENRGFDLP